MLRIETLRTNGINWRKNSSLHVFINWNLYYIQGCSQWHFLDENFATAANLLS